LGSLYQPGRKLAALVSQTGTDLEITMQPTSNFKTARDWLAQYADAPDLDRWGLATRDECIDADRISAGIKKVGETPVALLPFPAQILTEAQTAPVADWAWLALNANAGGLDRALFREKLAALNAAGGGVLRLKSPDSLLKWLEYGTLRGDGYVLGQLTADPPFDVLLYGPYRAEGQGTLNRETLVREAKVSGLGKAIKCLGYSTYRTGERVELFEVVTGDWTPGWDTWQARENPFAVFAFMPMRRSTDSLETTEGLYLNYLGVPQKSDIEQGFAKCPDLVGP
jgi:hypothetical protein